MRVSLKPHPESRCDPVRSLEVELRRPARDRLLLTYHVIGEIDALALPSEAEPERRDELWRHTCWEAFIKADGKAGYIELNASPANAWAAYHFADYRHGMRDVEEIAAERFATERSADAYAFHIHWRIPGLTVGRLGLTAIVEEGSGAKSYWALAHPRGQPDFHTAACFAIDLPPPAGA